MRLTRTHNRFVVPLEHAIQQTHKTSMRDERADFRFGYRHIRSAALKFFNRAAVNPKMDRS